MLPVCAHMCEHGTEKGTERERVGQAEAVRRLRQVLFCPLGVSALPSVASTPLVALPRRLEETREPATEAPGLLSHPGPAREHGDGCAWGWSSQVLPPAPAAALCPYTLVTCVYKGAAAHAHAHAHTHTRTRPDSLAAVRLRCPDGPPVLVRL